MAAGVPHIPENHPTAEPPSKDEIRRTTANAVAQGGAALALPHSGRTTVFRRPQGKLWSPTDPPERAEMANCGHAGLFTLPTFSPNPEPEAQRKADATRICAVCDCGHDFPRLQEEIVGP